VSLPGWQLTAGGYNAAPSTGVMPAELSTVAAVYRSRHQPGRGLDLMALRAKAAARAVTGILALMGLALVAACSGTLGASPPHAAPANPVAEPGDGFVDLSWDAVTGAKSYTIVWDDNPDSAIYDNKIKDIEETQFTHSGLTNLRKYHYRIVAESSGGTGPESVPLTAIPGPVPGPVEWAVVTAQNPGHTIYFAPAAGATRYRVYFAGLESQLAGRRPNAVFEETRSSPYVRDSIPQNANLYYRVIAMNGTRIGTGGPVVVSPAAIISDHDLTVAGAAFGQVNDDDCLDLPTAYGGDDAGICGQTFTARELDQAGLADLVASPRQVSDTLFADFNGDGFDELFSNTKAPASDPSSIALLHLNQGDGNFLTSAAVSALAIGGGGTLLAADFDNDGDVDLFAPNDPTQADGARNWLLINDGAGNFVDNAVAAGVATNPAGAAYVPRGGQAVDFDEDGFVDLVFGSRLLLNNGDGTFRDGSAAAHMPVREDYGLKLIDVDLDGDLDLVHHDGSVTRVYRNNGGVFDDGEVVGEEADDTFGHGLAACDINGDGFEDVVVARNLTSTGEGAPKILINVDGSLMLSATQEGTTTEPDSLIAPNAQLACGDKDNDGLIDVLAQWGDSYRVLRGASPLARRIRLRIVDGAGHRNQQGRIVRVVPVEQPNRIMTRVVDSGSGLRAQNQYDLLVGAPWPGDYTVTVRFAAGDVTTTLQAGDAKVIFADGRVEDINPDAG
jgi:FG-GAP-like repeat